MERKTLISKVNEYFGFDDRETALWYTAFLSFAGLCGVVIVIVEVLK